MLIQNFLDTLFYIKYVEISVTENLQNMTLFSLPSYPVSQNIASVALNGTKISLLPEKCS